MWVYRREAATHRVSHELMSHEGCQYTCIRHSRSSALERWSVHMPALAACVVRVANKESQSVRLVLNATNLPIHHRCDAIWSRDSSTENHNREYHTITNITKRKLWNANHVTNVTFAARCTCCMRQSNRESRISHESLWHDAQRTTMEKETKTRQRFNTLNTKQSRINMRMI